VRGAYLFSRSAIRALHVGGEKFSRGARLRVMVKRKVEVEWELKLVGDDVEDGVGVGVGMK
jgi:hypothetical protein